MDFVTYTAIHFTNRMETTIKTLYKTYGTILESYTKDEIDAMFIANDFSDDQSIFEAIHLANDSAWEYVYNNRTKYPTRIRSCIEPDDYKCRTKLRVVDLTDKVIASIEREKELAKRKEFDVYWETIKETIPERPRDELDDELDEAWDNLMEAKKMMTDYLAKKKLKYIPPSARKNVDSDEEEIEIEIQERQDEFDEIEKRIDEADKNYLAKRKDERFQVWLCQV